MPSFRPRAATAPWLVSIESFCGFVSVCACLTTAGPVAILPITYRFCLRRLNTQTVNENTTFSQDLLFTAQASVEPVSDVTGMGGGHGVGFNCCGLGCCFFSVRKVSFVFIPSPPSHWALL